MAAEPLFPPALRVVYNQNPLAEVICQVRYPLELKIETQSPLAFQEAIRGEFPVLERGTGAGLVPSGSPLGAAIPAIIAKARLQTYSFSTLDGRYRVGLTPEFCGVSTTSYSRWEEFLPRCRGPFDALFATYNPAVVGRLGLRYRNVIVRSKLGLDRADWQELLKPQILGELGFERIREKCEEAFRYMVIRLPGTEHFVRLEHGFVTQGDSPETCYLIDADFFAIQPKAETRYHVIDQFHQLAHSVFRWSITDRLHNALGPVLVE